MNNTIIATKRLSLIRLSADDADFILELVNTDDWMKYIGDRNIKDRNQALEYIENGPKNSYERHGYGLWGIKLNQTLIGICGLLERADLEYADLGYALLPEYYQNGFMTESCRGVITYASRVLSMKYLYAISDKNNNRSIHLLIKLGFIRTDIYYKTKNVIIYKLRLSDNP